MNINIYILLILIRLLLDYSYINFVHKNFEYMKFYLNFDVYHYMISLLCFILVLPILNRRLRRPSDYFFLMACIFFYIPITSIFGLDYDRSFYVIFLSLISIFIIYLVLNNAKLSFKGLPYIKYGKELSILLSVFFIFLVLTNYIFSGATMNFDLDLVYNFRDENAKLAQKGIFTYLNNWAYSIFTLYLMSICLKNGYWIRLFILIAAQVLFYAYSAHKAVLFMPVIVLVAWKYLSKNNLNLIPMGVIFTLLLCIFLQHHFNDILINSLYVRRVFFVPAQLSFSYVDFFNENEYVLWSQSILKSFINYPYSKDISSLIGSWMFGDDTRANNGLVSSGYANAGILGVFIYSLIIGVVLKVIDDFTISGGMPNWFSISLTASPLNVALIQSDLLTALLTHGLLISILLIFISRVK